MTEGTNFPLLPYSYVVGQDQLKWLLEVDYVMRPSAGGVLISGERGTAKSTIVRSFANVINERLPVTRAAIEFVEPADSAGHGITLPLEPPTVSDLDQPPTVSDLDRLDPAGQRRNRRPDPGQGTVEPPPTRAERAVGAGLAREYGLVALRRSRSGNLYLDRVRLFGPGDAPGSTVNFPVTLQPSGAGGTVFATFADSPATPDVPPELLVMQSAKIPPGNYDLTAELLDPYPGYVRFHGLPAALRADLRPWDEVVAAVPPHMPPGTGPAHLIAAIEISGQPAMVYERLDCVAALVQHVVSASAEPMSYSLITYGPHRINSNRADYPDVPVRTLAWDAPAEAVLDGLDAVARYGLAPRGYQFAAQLECMLAELANRLTGREGRPVLVTAGARPAHPPRPDPQTRYIPCPAHNDGLAIRQWLQGRHPGMGFGVIHPAGPEDDLWQKLGCDVMGGAFSAPDLAARHNLTGQPVQLLPLPLLAG